MRLYSDIVRKIAVKPTPPPLVRYTLTQIARDLGLSLTTVSRALSGTGRVGEDTRRRIYRHAEELQRAAMAIPAAPLASRLLGLFMPSYSVPLGMQTSIAVNAQESVQAVCEERGYGVVFGSFGKSRQPTVGDELLRTRALAGLILYRTRDEAGISRDLKGLPHVFVYRNLEGTGLNYVGVDFGEVMQLAIDHCLEMGFGGLGLVCGDASYPSQKGYRRAFLAGVEQAGLPLEPHWMEEVDLSETQGYQAATRMLSGKARPRAIICCSDRLAFGVLCAAHDLGKRVPRDVAVASIDGTVQTAYTRPELTAVQIPWRDMFTLATKLLLELIEGSTAVRNLGAKLRCELVVRESTAGAAARHVRGPELVPEAAPAQPPEVPPGATGI